MGIFDRVGRFIDDVLLLPEDVRASLSAAEDALKSDLPGEAEKLFLMVLSERPTLIRAAIGLAMAREQLGDVSGAMAALHEARGVAADDGELALWAARLSSQLGNHHEASRHAADATRALVSDNPELFAEACTLRASSEAALGRSDRAIRELRKAISVRTTPGRQVLLVENLVQSGRSSAALSVAEAIDTDDASFSTEMAARVGSALSKSVGLGTASRRWLSLGAEAGHAGCFVALSEAHLAAEEFELAKDVARRGLAAGGGAKALVALANAQVRVGECAEASEAFVAAAEMQDADALAWLRAAMRCVPLPMDAVDPSFNAAATHLSAHLQGQGLTKSQETVWNAARIWQAYAMGDSVVPEDVNIALLPTEPRGILGLAAMALRRDDVTASLAYLDDFAHVASRVATTDADKSLAAELRLSAMRSRWVVDGETDLAAAIDAVIDFSMPLEHQDVSGRARHLRDELDRPLLLAVLGEFNAGKSTLINAFIGSRVAPMGIVPTTATLNVLRGGAERRVRVVRADGTTREGDYGALSVLLDDAQSDGAVDHVEIVLPSETLERVWIMDAPGTNALDPEHERLAKEAARRADAVLWVFDAAQAGKKSENAMRERLKKSGRLVVPVLNKRDRLKDGELQKVLAVIEDGFGEAAIPVSAKAALAAREQKDEAGIEASGFANLMTHLENNVFSRARTLKRAACAGRLVAMIDEVVATEASLVDEQTTRIEHGAYVLSRLQEAQELVLIAAEDEVSALDAAQGQALLEAAAEVQEFVRPRTNQFATHGVHPEDRAFLFEVLSRRLQSAIETSQQRLRARVSGVLSQSGVNDVSANASHHLAKPYAGFLGFQKGMLSGGTLRRFFEEVLPRATLELNTLREGLAATQADPRVNLLPELEAALNSLLIELKNRNAQEQDIAHQRFELVKAQVFVPLRSLKSVLEES